MRKRKENTRGRNLNGQYLLQSFFLFEATHSESYYRRKMARLISLIVQIKRYGQSELNALLDIKLTECILNQPLIADRNWSRENPFVQIRFNRFLEVHINCYEKALKSLEEKLSQKHSYER